MSVKTENDKFLALCAKRIRISDRMSVLEDTLNNPASRADRRMAAAEFEVVCRDFHAVNREITACIKKQNRRSNRFWNKVLNKK